MSDRKDAHQEDTCLLCRANFVTGDNEMYTTVLLTDPSSVPLGKDYEDHMVDIPVCLPHFEAISQYQKGKNVNEVSV